ncbi:MAG: hypothetical protein WAQ53_16220 [Thiofilum sp.]|uniref:hypothetical protein n=1 Tax=Thiofilum sp. TaxID=2212733 RepID=UPI0025DDEFD4|nr:hypothetical protein [Thiofilum sp.]MBK8452395.1 hypothetical protein [Thiofilum sp.]
MKKVLTILAVLALGNISNVLADVSGSNSVSVGGGFAEVSVQIYNNGVVAFDTHAKSKKWNQGVKAETFAIGVDGQGNAIYVSQAFNIPTACGTTDTCSSNARKTFSYNIDTAVAGNVSKIDVYIGGRGALGPTLDGTINKAKEVCNALHIPCSLGN